MVGQQGYATITDWEYYSGRLPTSPTRTTEPSSPSIRLYDALVIGPYPRYYNARVMLKEFLPSAIELGVNEAEAYKLLYASDANEIDPDTVPVATLLGSFITDAAFDTPQFRASWASRFPMSPSPPAPGTPFLVFRWEGLQTGQSVAVAKEDVGNTLFNRFFPTNLYTRQSLFLRVFIARSLSALQYLHTTAALVHRSLGLASIMVNTTELRLVSSLQVKLRDLGFAKPVSALISGDELARAREAGAISPASIASFFFAEDIYALAYAFLEVIFSVFTRRVQTQDSLKTLFEDTFELDIDRFREYCEQDPECADVVRFLDQAERGGWALLRDMLVAKERFATVSIEALLQMPFLSQAL